MSLLVAAAVDPTDLQNLFDIVTPSPVPWWPPAPGWFVGGGVVLGLVIWLAWRAWERWHAAAYRRVSLAEWRRLKALADDPRQREAALQQLPGLMKRTALAAFPRQEVASLSGSTWLRFLDSTGHTDAFTRGQGQLLPELSYNPRAATQLDSSTVNALFAIARRWIRRHSTAVAATATRD
jgi:hypothetical protein